MRYTYKCLIPSTSLKAKGNEALPSCYYIDDHCWWRGSMEMTPKRFWTTNAKQIVQLNFNFTTAKQIIQLQFLFHNCKKACRNNRKKYTTAMFVHNCRKKCTTAKQNAQLQKRYNSYGIFHVGLFYFCYFLLPSLQKHLRLSKVLQRNSSIWWSDYIGWLVR